MTPSFVLLQHVPWVGHIVLTFGNVWHPVGPFIRERMIFAVLRRVGGLHKFRWVAREERGRGGNVHAHILVADVPAYEVIRSVKWYRQKWHYVARWTLVAKRRDCVGYVLRKLELARFAGNQLDRIWMSTLLGTVAKDS